MGLAQFDKGAGQRGQRFVQPPFGPVGSPLQPAGGIDHRAFGPVAAQHLQGAGHILPDADGALHGAAAGVQRRFLARLGGQVVQFGDRMAQEILLGPRGGQAGLGFAEPRARLCATIFG